MLHNSLVVLCCIRRQIFPATDIVTEIALTQAKALNNSQLHVPGTDAGDANLLMLHFRVDVLTVT